MQQLHGECAIFSIKHIFIFVHIEIEIWNQLNAVRKTFLSCSFYYENSIDLFDWALFARVTLLRIFLNQDGCACSSVSICVHIFGYVKSKF